MSVFVSKIGASGRAGIVTSGTGGTGTGGGATGTGLLYITCGNGG